MIKDRTYWAEHALGFYNMTSALILELRKLPSLIGLQSNLIQKKA